MGRVAYRSAVGFAFIVAHTKEARKSVPAECGPRELTATIVTAVSAYFSRALIDAPGGEVSTFIAHVNEFNRASARTAIAQDDLTLLPLLDVGPCVA